MSVIYRLLLVVAFSISLNSSLEAMKRATEEVDELVQEQAFIDAIMHRSYDQITKLNVSSFINKPLMMLKTALGAMVKVTPLLFAVGHGDEELVAQLLKRGALPLGDYHDAPGIETPLQEAFKLPNHQIFYQFKAAWIEICNKEYAKVQLLAKQVIKQYQGIEKKAGLSGMQIDQLVLDPILTREFVDLVLEGCVEELENFAQRNVNSILALVNTALLPTHSKEGDKIEISPLLYAVYNQKIPLINLLVKYGARILGKRDECAQLGSPLEETYKSKNDELVKIVRDLAYGQMTQQFEMEVSRRTSMLSISDCFMKELIKISAASLNKSVEQLEADAKKELYMYKDLLLMLKNCTLQEIDWYLQNSDMVAQQPSLLQQVEQLNAKISAKVAEGIIEKLPTSDAPQNNKLPDFHASTSFAQESDIVLSTYSFEQPADTALSAAIPQNTTGQFIPTHSSTTQVSSSAQETYGNVDQ